MDLNITHLGEDVLMSNPNLFKLKPNPQLSEVWFVSFKIHTLELYTITKSFFICREKMV